MYLFETHLGRFTISCATDSLSKTAEVPEIVAFPLWIKLMESFHDLLWHVTTYHDKRHGFVTKNPHMSWNVTKYHLMSWNVTKYHHMSWNVTMFMMLTLTLLSLFQEIPNVITNSDLNRPCFVWRPYGKSGLFKTELVIEYLISFISGATISRCHQISWNVFQFKVLVNR